MKIGKTIILLAALSLSASGAVAQDLRFSFANGTDRLLDSVYMQCDAGDGAMSGMGGEMFLFPGRTGSNGTEGEGISSIFFSAGGERYDFRDLSALGGNEVAARICTGADSIPELHVVPGRTAPSSCDGSEASVIKGELYAPLNSAADGSRISLDELLSQTSPEFSGSHAFAEGDSPLYEGFRFLRGDAAGCPLSVRIEIEDSVFDGAKLRKTAVFGASDKTEHLLSYLREKGMTPIFVQLKSGDTQQDVDHRSFFDAADAAEAWRVLSEYLQVVREGDDIPSVTCLFISEPDREKLRGDSPDITAVRGDFSKAAEFRLAIFPHAGGIIEAVR